MSDIFFEVKEAIEKEKMQKIWQKIKYPVIIFSMSVVVCVGVYEYILAKNMKKSANDQAVYATAIKDLKENRLANCLEKLDFIIKNGSDGYVQLALMMKAGIYNRIGDLKNRNDTYSALSARYKNMTSFFVCCEAMNGLENFYEGDNFQKLVRISTLKNDSMSNFAAQLLTFIDIAQGNNNSAKDRMSKLNLVQINYYLVKMMINSINGRQS